MAQDIIDICDNYNVTAVHMDSGAGGGGLALKDLLAEEKRFGNKCLLDLDDETTAGLNGRRILQLFKPSPTTNAEAVYNTLALMEKKLLSFPKSPQFVDPDSKMLDELEEAYDTVQRMLRQLMLIEVTQNKSGVAHFDVPTGGGHGAQKKDLYSSFILAAKKTYDLNLFIHDTGTLLEYGILENIKLSSHPGANNALSNSLSVINAPVNSWAQRKTFKPSGK
jgi:hypothetical protein